MELYLASGSPRRLELLNQIGMSPIVRIPQGIEETTRVWDSPEEMVRTLSFEKAHQVSEEAPTSSWTLGADTVVFQKNCIFGKPKNLEMARRTLEELSGKSHQVFTGLTLIHQKKVLQAVVATEVFFRSLKDEEIADYLATGEPMDKAGAYGIQGKGAVFVDKIVGCYFNVVGLPLSTFWGMIEEMRKMR